jgi:adenylate cyclase
MIVVADDDDTFRDTTKEFFESQRYLVLSARTGSEALARMRGIVGPVIAIIDLVMPGIDGWDLIETMRADPQLKPIPIIVLSGRAYEPIEGVNVVLQKPCDLATLLSHVNALLRG